MNTPNRSLAATLFPIGLLLIAMASIQSGASLAKSMFPIVGAPSASLGRLHRHEPLARYNLLRIDPAAGAIELIGRGMAEPGGTIVEVERRSLGRERPERDIRHIPRTDT